MLFLSCCAAVPRIAAIVVVLLWALSTNALAREFCARADNVLIYSSMPLGWASSQGRVS